MFNYIGRKTPVRAQESLNLRIALVSIACLSLFAYVSINDPRDNYISGLYIIVLLYSHLEQIINSYMQVIPMSLRTGLTPQSSVTAHLAAPTNCGK